MKRIKEETSNKEILSLLKPIMVFRLSLATIFFIIGSIGIRENRHPFFICIGVFFFTAALHLFQVWPQRRHFFLNIQIFLDVVIVTSLIAFAESAGAIFVFLYLIPIFSAALFFEERASVIVGLISGILYSSTLLLSHFNLSEGARKYGDVQLFYYMFLVLIIFGVVGFLCGRLVKVLKQKGEELSKLKSLHDLILLNMNSGLITTDTDNRIIYTNRATQEMLGFGEDEIKGKRLSDLLWDIYNGDEEPFEPKDINVKATRTEKSELLGRTKNGRKIPIGYNLSIIRNESGEPVGKIIVFTDLTKVKELEEKLRQADKLKAIGELAAGIAHEIRNPLASISGSIEMLADSVELSEENLKLLRIILKESDKLNQTIEEFLTYAKEGTLDIQKRNILDIIKEVVDLLKDDYTFGKNVAIELDNCTKNNLEVLGDELQLKQVFINLLRNSSEAMPEGGTIKIVVESSNGDGKDILIKITDTGIGIPSQEQKRIFEPFYTTKKKGLGIGLSIAEKIIRSHRGDISIESREGKGTTLTVCLPKYLDKSS